MLHFSSLISLKHRYHYSLSIVVLIILLTALYIPGVGTAYTEPETTIKLTSKGAPECSRDSKVSCISWSFKPDQSQDIPFVLDCKGDDVYLPLLRILTLLFGIEIPSYVPLPPTSVSLCGFAIGSKFDVIENPPPGSSDQITTTTHQYDGRQKVGVIKVKAGYTYTLTLKAHGRDYRDFFERYNVGTFDTFVELRYRELDPADDICPNALDFGIPYAGNLEFSGDHDWQRINSPVSGTMALILDVPPDKDYQLEIWSDNCLKKLEASEKGTGFDEQVVMKVDQVSYRVHVYGKTPEDFGSWYGVSALWDLDDNQWENAASFTLPIEGGNLEYSGDHDWQRIYVPSEGGSLVLEVPEGRNYEFELWRDDVKVQLAASKNESSLDEHIPLTQGGYYRIHTYGFDPATDFGAPYRVFLVPMINIPVLDTFDRADGPLGTDWLGFKSAYRILGNQVDVRRNGPLYWKDAFGVNQEVAVTIREVDPAGLEQDLLLKVQGQYGPNWGEGVIEVLYDAKANTVTVWTFRLDTLQWFKYSSIPVVFMNGDRFGAQVLANGNVLIYKNGLRIGRITLTPADQAFFNSRGGYIGVWFIDARNAFLDNFGGGDIEIP